MLRHYFRIKAASVDLFSDSTGRTILHWTKQIRMIGAFKASLSKQPTILNSADEQGITALYNAPQKENLKPLLFS